MSAEEPVQNNDLDNRVLKLEETVNYLTQIIRMQAEQMNCISEDKSNFNTFLTSFKDTILKIKGK